MCFGHVGVELEFKGEGSNEKGYVTSCNNSDYQIAIGQEVIAVDEKYFRPTEVDYLLVMPQKLKKN